MAKSLCAINKLNLPLLVQPPHGKITKKNANECTHCGAIVLETKKRRIEVAAIQLFANRILSCG